MNNEAFVSKLEILFKDQSRTFIAVDTNDLEPLLLDIEELYAQGKMYIKSSIKYLVSVETADKLFFIQLICKDKTAYQRQIYSPDEINEIIKKAQKIIYNRKSIGEKVINLLKNKKRTGQSFKRNYPFHYKEKERATA